MNKKRDIIVTAIIVVIYCTFRLIQTADNDWYLYANNVNLIAAGCLGWWYRNTKGFSIGLDSIINRLISVISCIVLFCLVVYSVYVKLSLEKIHVITVIIAALLWIVMAATVGIEPIKGDDDK